MDTRFRDFIQKERVAAVDEFIREFSSYMCEKKRYYKRPQWNKMIQEVREEMFHDRDLNRERDEPLVHMSHCIHVGPNNKQCPKRAVVGAYCNQHSSKASTP